MISLVAATQSTQASSLAVAAVAGIKCALLLALVMLAAAFFIWAERKIAGRIQDRLGPTRVGGRYGWLQSVADGLKLLAKEDTIPDAADRTMFRLAPYISFCAAFSVYLAIPLADGWVGQRLNIAVFFILAVASLEIYGVILGGYASGSKWSLFGAMREAVQVASYEVPLALCAVIPVMIAGTMDLVTIGNMQRGMFWNWLVLHDPFTFVAFWVYFTCAVASVNRAPFDLAEAESELVAGFMTEYSGFRWGVFMMGEYAAMLAVSCLATILFLGAWNGPIPVVTWLGLGADAGPVAAWLAGAAGACNFLFKAVLGVCVMIWVRWSLPRLRIDQVMATCLKYCIPLAAVCFLGAAVWLLLLPGGVFGGSAAVGVPDLSAAAALAPQGGPT